MRELFIYYRLRTADADAAAAAVQAFQAQLRQRHPALRTRLLRRPDKTDDLQTWMEIYSTDPMREPQGVDPILDHDIETAASALSPWLAGPRHTEVFLACAS